MTARNAQFGRKRELDMMERLEEDGWEVQHSSASKGPCDLLAGRRGKRNAIQVKGNKGSPFKDFGPAEREELLVFARAFEAQAVLVHWPPYGQATWIYPSEWPQPKKSGTQTTSIPTAAP